MTETNTDTNILVPMEKTLHFKIFMNCKLKKLDDTLGSTAHQYNKRHHIVHKLYIPEMKLSNPFVIENRKGQLIAFDVYTYQLYGSDILVQHTDKSYSLYNKNGKAYEGAYRQKTLFAAKDLWRGLRYGPSEKSVRPVDDPVVALAKRVFGLSSIERSADLMTHYQEKTAEQKTQDNQEAASVKATHTIDISAAHNLTVSDNTVFLNEKAGQTKTIGSWKGHSSNRTVFMQYNRPQHEKQ